jgi:nucleobase:cation symporter-1, NCS1 family
LTEIETIRHSDGRVELAFSESIAHSPAFNEDLAPVPVAARHWSGYHFAALWAGMACNIPTYMMASGLIASGMNWWQALLTILLGNSIVLVPILLNSHAGTKYGIPFPVLVRASYGIRGSNLPAMMRAFVACGWFGINAWIGGQAMFTLIKALYPAWPDSLGGSLEGHTVSEWVSFLLFWLLNIFVIYHGMEFLKKFESLAAPFVFLMTGMLVYWTGSRANGFGTLLSEPGKYTSWSTFFPVFVPSVTAMIGSWATLSLNMPDFTRFSRSQKDQVVGQIAALPASMTLFSAMGVMTTAAGLVLYPHLKPEQLWDPVILIGQFKESGIVALAMFTVMLATLSVNVAANVVSPANDLANCFPKWISFRTGALITAVAGILIQPWKILNDPQGFFSFLLTYSGGLGSIAGVMIVDYWYVRKKELLLPDLYLVHGAYEYSGGWNWRAVVATLAGCTLAWAGLAVPALKVLYDYSWFVGLFVAAGMYALLSAKQRSSAVYK